MKSIYIPASLTLGATIFATLPLETAPAMSMTETRHKKVLLAEHRPTYAHSPLVSVPSEIRHNNWLAQTETPQEWAKQGFDKFQQGDAKGALHDLDTSISLDAENALAYISRGLVYTSIEEFTQAKKDTQLAAQLFQAQDVPEAHAEATQLLQVIDYLSQLQNSNPTEYKKVMQEIKSSQFPN